MAAMATAVSGSQRWTTGQVSVRVMPGTAWTLATTSLPELVDAARLAADDDVVRTGDVLGHRDTLDVGDLGCHRRGLADLGLDQDVSLDGHRALPTRVSMALEASDGIRPERRGVISVTRRGRVRADPPDHRPARRRRRPRGRPRRRRRGGRRAGRPGGRDHRPDGRGPALPPRLVERVRRRPQGGRGEPGRRRRDGRAPDRGPGRDWRRRRTCPSSGSTVSPTACGTSARWSGRWSPAATSSAATRSRSR